MRGTSWLAAGVALAAGAATAQQAARPGGYLEPGEFDVSRVVEPAPQPGDPRYETDRDIFRDTRRLVGTPRYELATRDADTRVPAMLANFSCAVGVTLTPENSPRLVAAIQRAARDTSAQSGRAKEFYKRERPYVIDTGPMCQNPAELADRSGKASYDYPSGHSTWGWTWAVVLAGAAPDRAQKILERGRAYADSRFVCGAHNESAVEGGMLSAGATMALIQTKPAFQADLAAARTELTALRRSGAAPAPATCEAEARLVAQRVMPALPPPP